MNLKRNTIDALRAAKPQVAINVRLWLQIATEIFPPSCYRENTPSIMLNDEREVVFIVEWRGRRWVLDPKPVLVFERQTARNLRHGLLCVRAKMDEEADRMEHM